MDRENFLIFLATVTVDEGRERRRLAERHRRPYQSIFGRFELERIVHGAREGQRIEYVPLDTRLRLPAGPFSYLSQGWDSGPDGGAAASASQ